MITVWTRAGSGASDWYIFPAPVFAGPGSGGGALPGIGICFGTVIMPALRFGTNVAAALKHSTEIKPALEFESEVQPSLEFPSSVKPAIDFDTNIGC
jgi:hypothetical protein